MKAILCLFKVEVKVEDVCDVTEKTDETIVAESNSDVKMEGDCIH